MIRLNSQRIPQKYGQKQKWLTKRNIIINVQFVFTIYKMVNQDLRNLSFEIDFNKIIPLTTCTFKRGDLSHDICSGCPVSSIQYLPVILLFLIAMSLLLCLAIASNELLEWLTLVGAVNLFFKHLSIHSKCINGAAISKKRRLCWTEVKIKI